MRLVIFIIMLGLCLYGLVYLFGRLLGLVAKLGFDLFDRLPVNLRDAIQVLSFIYIILLVLWFALIRSFFTPSDIYDHVPCIDFFMPFALAAPCLFFCGIGNVLMSFSNDSDAREHSDRRLGFWCLFGSVICFALFFFPIFIACM